jgi:hypothetical protein
MATSTIKFHDREGYQKKLSGFGLGNSTLYPPKALMKVRARKK